MSNIIRETGNSASVGEKIRVARETRGWTQKDLAQKLSTSKGSVSRWEQDKSYPGGRYLVRLGEALDLGANWWGTPEDEPSSATPSDAPASVPDPAPPELDRALRSIRDDFLAGRTILQAEAWLKRLRHITTQASELMTFPTIAADAAAEAHQTAIRNAIARRGREKAERVVRRARRAR